MMVRDGAAGAGSGGRVPPSVIGISRRERRAADRGRASIEFGVDAAAALDLLDLLGARVAHTHGEIDTARATWSRTSGRRRGRPRRAGVRLAARRHRLADLRLAADVVRSRLAESVTDAARGRQR